MWRGLVRSVWRRHRRRELRRVSSHLGGQLGPSKKNWVPIWALQKRLGPFVVVGSDNYEVEGGQGGLTAAERCSEKSDRGD